MVTKEEFESQWNNCKEDVKKIRLTSGDCVFATCYWLAYSTIMFEVDGFQIGVFNFDNIKGIECE